MKIQKRAVKSSTELVDTSLEISDNNSCYQCAVDYIIQAIECLGDIAKEDMLARESIANLSVVLFDLKC